MKKLLTILFAISFLSVSAQYKSNYTLTCVDTVYYTKATKFNPSSYECKRGIELKKPDRTKKFFKYPVQIQLHGGQVHLYDFEGNSEIFPIIRTIPNSIQEVIQLVKECNAGVDIVDDADSVIGNENTTNVSVTNVDETYTVTITNADGSNVTNTFDIDLFEGVDTTGLDQLICDITLSKIVTNESITTVYNPVTEVYDVVVTDSNGDFVQTTLDIDLFENVDTTDLKQLILDCVPEYETIDYTVTNVIQGDSLGTVLNGSDGSTDTTWVFTYQDTVIVGTTLEVYEVTVTEDGNEIRNLDYCKQGELVIDLPDAAEQACEYTWDLSTLTTTDCTNAIYKICSVLPSNASIDLDGNLLTITADDCPSFSTASIQIEAVCIDDGTVTDKGIYTLNAPPLNPLCPSCPVIETLPLIVGGIVGNSQATGMLPALPTGFSYANEIFPNGVFDLDNSTGNYTYEVQNVVYGTSCGSIDIVDENGNICSSCPVCFEIIEGTINDFKIAVICGQSTTSIDVLAEANVNAANCPSASVSWVDLTQDAGTTTVTGNTIVYQADNDNNTGYATFEVFCDGTSIGTATALFCHICGELNDDTYTATFNEPYSHCPSENDNSCSNTYTLLPNVFQCDVNGCPDPNLPVSLPLNFNTNTGCAIADFTGFLQDTCIAYEYEMTCTDDWGNTLTDQACVSIDIVVPRPIAKVFTSETDGSTGNVTWTSEFTKEDGTPLVICEIATYTFELIQAGIPTYSVVQGDACTDISTWTLVSGFDVRPYVSGTPTANGSGVITWQKENWANATGYIYAATGQSVLNGNTPITDLTDIDARTFAQEIRIHPTIGGYGSTTCPYISVDNTPDDICRLTHVWQSGGSIGIANTYDRYLASDPNQNYYDDNPDVTNVVFSRTTPYNSPIYKFGVDQYRQDYTEVQNGEWEEVTAQVDRVNGLQSNYVFHTLNTRVGVGRDHFVTYSISHLKNPSCDNFNATLRFATKRFNIITRNAITVESSYNIAGVQGSLDDAINTNTPDFTFVFQNLGDVGIYNTSLKFSLDLGADGIKESVENAQIEMNYLY